MSDQPKSPALPSRERAKELTGLPLSFWGPAEQGDSDRVLRAYAAGKLHTDEELEAVRKQSRSEGRAAERLMADQTDRDVLRARWPKGATEVRVTWHQPHQGGFKLTDQWVQRPEAADPPQSPPDHNPLLVTRPTPELDESLARDGERQAQSLPEGCTVVYPQGPRGPRFPRPAAEPPLFDAGLNRTQMLGHRLAEEAVKADPMFSDPPTEPPECTCPGDGFTVADDCPLHAGRILTAQPGPPDLPPTEPPPDFEAMRKWDSRHSHVDAIWDLIAAVERLYRTPPPDHQVLLDLIDDVSDEVKTLERIGGAWTNDHAAIKARLRTLEAYQEVDAPALKARLDRMSARIEALERPSDEVWKRIEALERAGGAG